jgi:hypothetical protein
MGCPSQTGDVNAAGGIEKSLGPSSVGLDKIIWGSGILKINSRPRDLIFKSSHGQVTKSKSRVLQINNDVLPI